jgi:hypothetical protein
LSLGCRNSNAPLTNPFLTPDRVPPPSTRTLTPGTAQPYYPGDPLPGAAPAGLPVGGYPASPPVGGFVPSTVPPATAYPGAGAYPSGPVTPTAPVTPPGGWGTYGPRADNSSGANLIAGDAVTIPSDQQQTRFGSATLSAPAYAPTAGSTAAEMTPAQFRTPIQSLVPPSQDQLAAMPADRPFTPNAGSLPPIQRAAYDETPAIGQPTAQRLQVREVQPAEYIDPRVNGLTLGSGSSPSRDGFRPQGSAPRLEDDSESSSKANGFRSPSTAGSQSGDAQAQFGVGPNQEWLRGQLEYWPTTGEWSIKYMGDGAVDQIGGRILIDNPQVLGHLPPGEFVMVEGQVFGRQIDEATYRPAYRVAVVQRQHK